MTTIEDLTAIDATRQLEVRYRRLFDARRWDAGLDVFTPDAGFEGFSSIPEGSTRSAGVPFAGT
jgi:hypothetical protein